MGTETEMDTIVDTLQELGCLRGDPALPYMLLSTAIKEVELHTNTQIKTDPAPLEYERHSLNLKLQNSKENITELTSKAIDMIQQYEQLEDLMKENKRNMMILSKLKCNKYFQALLEL